MAEIFISYRRDDSAAWAGRLYDHFARFLSRSRLFMDVDGNIRAGSNYEKIIQQQLDGAHALLAVIGPQWATLARDGHPRLHCDDDWVRREIAAALTRDILVIPVLVGGATLPSIQDLPSELAALVKSRHVARLDDTQWDIGVATVIEVLQREIGAPLGPENDFNAAAKALTELARLIRDSPAFAMIVGKYEEVVASYIREIEDLEFYKRLHDAIHTVEIKVLSQLLVNPTKPQIISSRGNFRQFKCMIEGYLEERPEEVSLHEDLAYITEAIEGPTDDTHLKDTIDATVSALSTLVGVEPTKFNLTMVNTAKALHRNHQRLAELIAELRQAALSDSVAHAQRLAPVFDGLERLTTALSEFSRLVDEHSRIQALDSTLRVLCASPSCNRGLWSRFKSQRGQLPRPYSVAVAAQSRELAELEEMVDSALAAKTTKGPLDALYETLSVLFWSVDSHLRDVSRKLLSLIGPLQTIIQPKKS